MTAVHAQIVQSTGDFHHQIREILFGVAKNILDNATALDASNRVFDNNAYA